MNVNTRKIINNLFIPYLFNTRKAHTILHLKHRIRFWTQFVIFINIFFFVLVYTLYIFHAIYIPRSMVTELSFQRFRIKGYLCKRRRLSTQYAYWLQYRYCLIANTPYPYRVDAITPNLYCVDNRRRLHK